MKRILSVLLLLCLLLSGCAAPAAEVQTTEDVSETGIALPVTEDAIRTAYEAEDQTVLAITPYEGDFLVELGPSAGPQLDWVFGASGLRRTLLFSDEGLQFYQILSSGIVQFTTDGVRAVDGYREFPYTGTVSFDGQWGSDGQAADYDPYGAGETPTVECYWAERTEDTAFGMAGRSEAVLDARVDIAGLEMVFGPMSGQDFDAAFCAPPGVEISCEGDVMTVVCRDTYLDCMALSDGEPADLKLLQTEGTLYPDSFPAGALGTNYFISQSEITQEGSTVVVRLTLTEPASQYTVECGSLGPLDSRPYFRLSFREVG